MTHKPLYNLSRRKVLGGLGVVGLASVGAGVGTSAYFNDTETFSNNVLTAGELDLLVNYYSYWDQGSHGMGSTLGTADGEAISGVLTDVKPGDNGLLAFCFEIVDNPAYLWACGDLTENAENGQTEPEINHSTDTTGGDPGPWEGELAQAIQVDVNYCSVADDLDAQGDDGFDPADVTHIEDVYDGSLADFLSMIEYGVPLDGAAGAGILSPGEQFAFHGTSYSAGDEVRNPCLCIDWELPTSVGNEVQTDSLAFDLTFYAEQARHNDGTSNPCASGTGFSTVSYQKALNMQALAAVQNNAEIQVHGDSGGVEYDFADKFPANTDIPFTALIDAGANTASLTVLGETVTDTDVTDGTANGGSTGDPEWPMGVPATVDIALNANSAAGNGVTTVVKDVSVNGGPTLPMFSSSSGTVYYVVPGVDTSSNVTVTGTMRFEGAETDYTSQDWVGIDFR